MQQHESFVVGIDVGSITVKFVLLSSTGKLLQSYYRRHGAAVQQTLADILSEVISLYPHAYVRGRVTGSASLALSKILELPFEQEVLAAERAIRCLDPNVDVAIELGGEDAKVLYLSQSTELRMNEACAGGTGAFIDQMATLLDTDAFGLNTLAERATRVYPIASRCGVFAKTDVVSLLNEGVSKENLAASIFQAVVEQTISGLACGRPIKGRIAFLGGPLHFLPELCKCFTNTLRPEDSVSFPNGQFMVALGAALGAKNKDTEEPVLISDLLARVHHSIQSENDLYQTMPPLFSNRGEYEEFCASHSKDSIPHGILEKAQGNVFLGIDCGSTTVKAVLIDQNGCVLDSMYGRNEGNPLVSLLPYVADILDRLPQSAHLCGCASTGYGAELARVALDGELEEVETVAHLTAARKIEPKVDSIIDIGGQDMKYLRLEDGCLADIKLNEACSSGCGAFLETFAKSLGLTMPEFVQAALFAEKPVDLGSRCTVFMNSKVKQAQKEGATIPDIAAGLCYSVARNALYKVLRLRDTKELGENVLVQGGSFLNDALLCVIERLLGRSVRRPDLAGHMGAYGAALLAMEHSDEYPSSTLTSEKIRSLTVTPRSVRCEKCGNHCLLTVSSFSNGRKLISGNRCERGNMLKKERHADVPNMYLWKAEHVFAGKPLETIDAPRGVIGIPRVLNMYELYPFWFTLFTRLGFRVELSPPSNKEIYALGFDSMPSQTVCLPAKLVHGHIAWLVEHGIKRIFYPCLPWEKQQFNDTPDCYNCPVVAGYPEVIRLNTDILHQNGCKLYAPFVRLEHKKALIQTFSKEFDIDIQEVSSAVCDAYVALDKYRSELCHEGERILAEIKQRGLIGIVLAGRPYHVDPFVNHGLPELITSLGAALISEDAIAHLSQMDESSLRIVDQWAFHARLYRAADVVTSHRNLELVQLTSFGCGLDAITADQASEILRSYGRLHTLIKIDEGSSLGAARIRLRSLMAAVREHRGIRLSKISHLHKNTLFTVPMRKTHTIFVPQMAPIHFAVLEGVFKGNGYKVRLLSKTFSEDIEAGLKYVHNDACFPAQVVIGQIINALKNCEDIEHSAVLLTQTCGPCRATNYPALLKKALDEAGLSTVSVLTMRSGGVKTSHPGFTISHGMYHQMIRAVIYGDMLQRLYYACCSHERRKGDSKAMLDRWIKYLAEMFSSKHEENFKKTVLKIASDFSRIPCDNENRPKVGIVGEILMTYHPDANRNVADVILDEGGEPVLPELAEFLLYCMSDGYYARKSTGGALLPALLAWGFIHRIDSVREHVRKALAQYGFTSSGRFFDLASNGSSVVSLSNQAGEGWLLTAEMVRFISGGVNNVLCLQPFGCLPNHITGRGVFKELKHRYPKANLMAVDYEAGSSEANLLNRIKLFMSIAR